MEPAHVESGVLVDQGLEKAAVTVTAVAEPLQMATHSVADLAGDNSQSPSHWPRSMKWTATMILSAFAFLQPLSETMLAPAQKQISDDLHIAQPYQWILLNSLILVGVGSSPLLLAPLSEVYGRKPILIGASIVFIVWNTACGASNTFGQITAFRFLSGFGASVADALAGGDLWSIEERGRAFAIYMAAPLLGPALGPILGAFISQGTSWRWIFWVTSIASAIVTIIALIFLHETYEPRREYLRNRQGRKSSDTANPMTNSRYSFRLVGKSLQRPFRMLGTQAIIQLLAVYMAILYGTMFLFLFMYPVLWSQQYHESVGIGSLNYISFAIGLILGVNVAGHLNDYIYIKLKSRKSANGIGRPEYRVPPMVIGTILVPTGLLWWGWTGEARLHWILPNIGSLLLGTGIYICSGCVSVYTIDTLAAAFFPLFAPYLFDALGFGLGATVLAGAFTALGTMIVLVLWFFGETLRARSAFIAPLQPVEVASS
ncbi:MFS general substrate transporter [Hypoxylon sp. NC1633]|nr:MFS general substrate transporter [Hypoxylon sp. NC1633]